MDKKLQKGAGEKVNRLPVQTQPVLTQTQGEEHTQPPTPNNNKLTQNKIDGMSAFRESIQDLGFSTEAEQILLSSWRQGTMQQYQTYTSQWFQYCRENKKSVLSPAVGDVVNFLTELFKKGVGYSALNTARSALSAFIKLDGVPCGNNTFVKRFLKGVFQLRPALPKNNVIWDTEIVISFVRNMDVSKLKMLTYKTVILLALSTGQRAQSLHSLDIRNITLTEHEVKLRFGEVLKTTRPGHHQCEIVLGKFSELNLCVAETLKTYLIKTELLRDNVTQNKLFLSYQKPHTAVSKATISRWIKVVLVKAGVDMTIFTPHSTRAASASAAFRANVPVQTILNTAGWSKESTFAKFYLKPVAKN
ncbi:uncharacterized protein [Argopecten irradians]|uniref:uncharacterized protein n=1 Tax=Argopecten irradians TaxID=31199 RepID=UPI00371E7D50